MKEKYIDERFSPWMEFGVWPLPGGEIDIVKMDGNGSGPDVVSKIPRDLADKVMLAHNLDILNVYKLVNAFEAAAPEAFKKFWYEDWNK